MRLHSLILIATSFSPPWLDALLGIPNPSYVTSAESKGLMEWTFAFLRRGLRNRTREAPYSLLGEDSHVH
jgi:hypothetical protein